MICNSTPLILLARINKLELLKKLFGTITIPEDVKKEVIVENKPGFIVLNNAIKDKWIRIRNPKNNKELNLGKGENAAINLAMEAKDRLIIDDAVGIRVAQELNIETLRTTTIIFMALKKKIINKEDAIELINKLIENGYYISNEYYAKILTKLK